MRILSSAAVIAAALALGTAAHANTAGTATAVDPALTGMPVDDDGDDDDSGKWGLLGLLGLLGLAGLKRRDRDDRTDRGDAMGADRR